MTLWIECPHRGQRLRRLTVGKCSTDRRVFACAVNGECIHKLPLKRLPEMKGIAECAYCKIPRLATGDRRC